MKCPYCGQPNSDKARTCARCGRRLDGAREKRRERRLLVYGIILVIVILAVGIVAMLAVSRMMQSSAVPEAEETPNVVINTPTPTPTPTPAPTEEPEEEEEEVEEAQNSVTLIDDDRRAQVDVMGYSPVVVSDSQATSTIYQSGMDNNPYVLYDGQDYSSWQEGVSGDGTGESVTLTFDREYQIHYITLRLGNWSSEGDYTENNRPQTITFELGNEMFTVTFPDEMREYCLELTRDIPASQMKITLDAMYKGTLYDDTCINEITVYGI